MHLPNQKSEDSGQWAVISNQCPVVRGPWSCGPVDSWSFAAFCFLFSVLALFSGGCSKSPTSDLRPPTSASSLTPLASNTVLRVHWVGKQQLGVAASASSFMRIWNQPISRQLEAHFIEQLATAPWRLITNRPPTSAPPVPGLMAMISDVLNEEACLEIRQGMGGSEVALAVRMDEPHRASWHRELAAVVSSLEGNYPAPRAGGWSLKGQSSGKFYETLQKSGWYVVGISSGSNGVFQEITQRLEREHAPFTITTNAHWVAVEADLDWLAHEGKASVISDQSSVISDQKSEGGGRRADLPRLALTVYGDGANTITSGELGFPKPLPLNLEPWAFPKEQVRGPVVGFSAARGIQSWIEGTAGWRAFKLGAAPNQFFAWADANAPLQIHVLAPCENAGQLTEAVGGNLAPKANAWLAQHGIGSVVPWADIGGIVWKDLPMIAPYLRVGSGKRGAEDGKQSSVISNQRSEDGGRRAEDSDQSSVISHQKAEGAWLEAGLIPNANHSAPPAPVYPRLNLEEILTALNQHTNLIAYEWETTGDRAEATHTIGQILRVALRRPQIPAGTPTSTWLQNVRPRLGNCTTTVRLTAPNTLAFERKSTVGFNALELHILADWMESPQFPRGSYSTGAAAQTSNQ